MSNARPRTYASTFQLIDVSAPLLSVRSISLPLFSVLSLLVHILPGLLQIARLVRGRLLALIGGIALVELNDFVFSHVKPR